MAIYHLAMKPISRASGRSAVAAAAYRASQKLTNERDGQTHDFTARRGVEHTEILLPDGVEAEWAKDRSTLWNSAEFAEVRKDARVAREVEVALPHELTPEQRLAQLEAQRKSLQTKLGKQERARDTRRKILLGALVLHRLEKGQDAFSKDQLPDWLRRELPGFITRDDDAALFPDLIGESGAASLPDKT